MAKSVSSKDPRKKAIVARLKLVSRATKVTLVKDLGNGVFTGHCQIPEIVNDGRFTIKTGAWKSLGDFKVQAQLDSLGNIIEWYDGPFNDSDEGQP